MRKTIVLVLGLLIAGSCSLRAQSIRNTAWKMYVDELHDTITLHINTDSSWVSQGKSGYVVVRSVFTVSKDTVTMNDYEGQYSCPGDKGVYTYTLKDNILSFFVVGDGCEGRRNTLNGAKWTKQP